MNTDQLKPSGVLFVAATPIGNLDDVSARLRTVLTDADFVGCEDTRRTSTLMSHVGASAKLIRVDAHAKTKVIDACVQRLADGATGVVVSDAGSPGVSDPGAALVHACAQAGIRVEVVAGPSAVSAIVSVCGFEDTGYRFWGFMPRTESLRASWCETVAQSGTVAVAFLSPHRISAELASLARHLPDAQICLGRELTKLHETLYRGTPGQLVTMEIPNKGEFVAAIQLAEAGPDEENSEAAQALVWLKRLSDRGLKGRALADTVYEIAGGNKKEIYQMAHQLHVD